MPKVAEGGHHVALLLGGVRPDRGEVGVEEDGRHLGRLPEPLGRLRPRLVPLLLPLSLHGGAVHRGWGVEPRGFGHGRERLGDLLRAVGSGGLLGTLFGAGVGPIYVVYINTLRMEREIFRVTMSTVVLLGGAARIAGYARLGFYEASSVVLIAIGLPLVVIGSWLGDRLIRRLDPRVFSWLVSGLILLSGVALLLK